MDVASTPLAGTWWRHIPAGADVDYEPHDPADNRWQRGTVVEALYFSDSEATVWAEWFRWLAEAALPPKHGLPRDLWRWKISLAHVADLTDDGRLARVGLPRILPTRTQWPTFQSTGEQLHNDGWPAVVSYSAARPEGRTLCVFRTARRIPGTRPAPPPDTITELPMVPRGLRT